MKQRKILLFNNSFSCSLVSENHSSGGFSLLELIMVFLLIAIIAVIIINPKSYLLEIRRQQAIRKIKSDIRYAQSYSLSSEKRIRISFYPDTESYSVYIENTPGNWDLLKDPLTKKDFTVDFSVEEFKGVDITQTNFDGMDFGLVFDAGGKPYSYNPSDQTISVLSTQGIILIDGGISVAIEPNTGKVS